MMNGLFHMDLHLTVRLVVAVVLLGMFWPRYWPFAHRGRVLALNLSNRPNALVGKLDAIAKVVCFEQTAHH